MHDPELKYAKYRELKYTTLQSVIFSRVLIKVFTVITYIIFNLVSVSAALVYTLSKISAKSLIQFTLIATL